MIDKEYFNINNDLFENDLANNAFEMEEISESVVGDFMEEHEHDDFLEEGRLLAVGTGIGGFYSGGPLSAGYDLDKEKSARRALAQLRGDPIAQYEADNAGSALIHKIGSSIPLLGIIATNNAYQRRMDAEDELRAEIEKRGLRK